MNECSEWGPFFAGIYLGIIVAVVGTVLMWNERVQAFFTRDPASLAAVRRERRISVRVAELVEMGLDPRSADDQARAELKQEYLELQQALTP